MRVCQRKHWQIGCHCNSKDVHLKEFLPLWHSCKVVPPCWDVYLPRRYILHDWLIMTAVFGGYEKSVQKYDTVSCVMTFLIRSGYRRSQPYRLSPNPNSGGEIQGSEDVGGLWPLTPLVNLRPQTNSFVLLLWRPSLRTLTWTKGTLGQWFPSATMVVMTIDGIWKCMSFLFFY